jgi:hypothetical protein
VSTRDRRDPPRMAPNLAPTMASSLAGGSQDLPPLHFGTITHPGPLSATDMLEGKNPALSLPRLLD